MGENDTNKEVWQREIEEAKQHLNLSEKILFSALANMPPREDLSHEEEQMYVAGVLLVKYFAAFHLWYQRWKQGA